MPNRKDFLKLSSSLAFGGLLFPRNAKAFYSNRAMPAVGLQLFTLFNVIDDDVSGSLKKEQISAIRKLNQPSVKKVVTMD